MYTRWNEKWRNYDIPGYCAGVKMQLWVYMRLRKMFNMPEFIREVRK